MRRAFSLYLSNGVGWLRFFGYGIIWKDMTKNHLSANERNGYRKFIRIGKWVITPIS